MHLMIAVPPVEQPHSRICAFYSLRLGNKYIVTYYLAKGRNDRVSCCEISHAITERSLW